MPPAVAPVGGTISAEAQLQAMELEWDEITARRERRLLAGWRGDMTAMEREWRDIAARRTTTLVAGWNEAMAEMRREQERLVSEGRWMTGPSDFFGILGLARRENPHSRMLKWLLTPTARHGLGSGLLERVVRRCRNEPVSAPINVRKVAFSVWRNDREADLVVWARDFTLVIENKVDASEQPNQCDDLYCHFEDEKAPLFLFLTPDGRKPVTATRPCARRAFQTLAWSDIASMLEDALTDSPVAAVGDAADIARNYLQTLREQFR